MAKDRNRNTAPATDSDAFSGLGAAESESSGASESSGTTETAAAPAARSKKPRTPAAELVKGMNRAERAVYYTKHVRTHRIAIRNLRGLVGEDAVKLAEEEFQGTKAE